MGRWLRFAEIVQAREVSVAAWIGGFVLLNRRQ
jgi:hypothetical protein